MGTSTLAATPVGRLTVRRSPLLSSKVSREHRDPAVQYALIEAACAAGFASIETIGDDLGARD